MSRAPASAFSFLHAKSRLLSLPKSSVRSPSRWSLPRHLDFWAPAAGRSPVRSAVKEGQGSPTLGRRAVEMNGMGPQRASQGGGTGHSSSGEERWPSVVRRRVSWCSASSPSRRGSVSGQADGQVEIQGQGSTTSAKGLAHAHQSRGRCSLAGQDRQALPGLASYLAPGTVYELINLTGMVPVLPPRYVSSASRRPSSIGSHVPIA
ncbi:hypothetical protein NL676_038211 [Syzygium grande]|nr:hypothetical protein NL676_038211 [Syzygium grande]